MLNRCRTLKFYPGFESLPHRQLVVLSIDLSFGDPPRLQHVSKLLQDGGLIEQPNRAIQSRRTAVHVALQAQLPMSGELLNRLARRPRATALGGAGAMTPWSC